MLFDSTAIICSLIASVVASWPATDEWPFGFHRVETMAGFVNALALFFASGHILIEAIERLWEPVELKTGKLIVVAVLGLIVNIGIFKSFTLVGIFAFDHGMLHAHHGHHDHSHNHHDEHDHQHDHGHHHDHHHQCSGSHNQSHLMQGKFVSVNEKECFYMCWQIL
jgi:zinc transporter 5/7